MMDRPGRKGIGVRNDRQKGFPERRIASVFFLASGETSRRCSGLDSTNACPPRRRSDGGALPAVSRELVAGRRRSNLTDSRQTVPGSYWREPQTTSVLLRLKE